jgi:hypothetical protein
MFHPSFLSKTLLSPILRDLHPSHHLRHVLSRALPSLCTTSPTPLTTQEPASHRSHTTRRKPLRSVVGPHAHQQPPPPLAHALQRLRARSTNLCPCYHQCDAQRRSHVKAHVTYVSCSQPLREVTGKVGQGAPGSECATIAYLEGCGGQIGVGWNVGAVQGRGNVEVMEESGD